MRPTYCRKKVLKREWRHNNISKGVVTRQRRLSNSLLNETPINDVVSTELDQCSYKWRWEKREQTGLYCTIQYHLSSSTFVTFYRQVFFMQLCILNFIKQGIFLFIALPLYRYILASFKCLPYFLRWHNCLLYTSEHYIIFLISSFYASKFISFLTLKTALLKIIFC